MIKHNGTLFTATINIPDSVTRDKESEQREPTGYFNKDDKSSDWEMVQENEEHEGNEDEERFRRVLRGARRSSDRSMTRRETRHRQKQNPQQRQDRRRRKRTLSNHDRRSHSPAEEAPEHRDCNKQRKT